VLSSRPRFSICIAIFVAPTFRVFAWCKFNFQPSWLTRPHTHPAAPLNSLLFLYFFARIYFYTFFFRWSLVTDHSTSFSTLVTHATWFLATAAIHQAKRKSHVAAVAPHISKGGRGERVHEG